MKVGAVGYSCASGLGHLNKWFFENHVVDGVFVIDHPQYKSNPSWFPGAPSTPLRRMDIEAMATWAKGFDVILFYETPYWWGFPSFCRENGVKTALLVMHEWYPQDKFGAFDLCLCPSVLDFEVFWDTGHTAVRDGDGFLRSAAKGGGRAVQVTVPADPSTWRQRSTVRRFLHNAGHVGHREHKGTRQLLEAMRHVKQPIDLTVRGQGVELERLLRQFGADHGTLKGNDAGAVISYDTTDRPYGDLFPPEFDAYVAPEKLNGLSLPLQEARAAGMLVVTTDRYPANTWLPNKVPTPSHTEKEGDDPPEGDVLNPLIPVERYQKARVSPGCVEVDEAVVAPEAIAATLDAWHGADVTGYSRGGLAWAKENDWSVWGPRYRKLLEELP